jgi:hypothetical protein
MDCQMKGQEESIPMLRAVTKQAGNLAGAQLETIEF